MLRDGSAWPCNRPSGPANAHVEKTKKTLNKLINKSINFTSPLRAERQGHKLQTANGKFRHLQQKSNSTRRTCTWKTVWGGSATRSSATGPTHLERSQLIQFFLTVIIVGWLLSRLVRTGPAHLGKCQLIGTKLNLKKHENIVGQPLNQLVCNRANSSLKYKNGR